MIYESDDSKQTVVRLEEPDFQGRVVSIHIENVLPINGQSCDVQKVILEYTDKVIRIKHVHKGELGTMEIIKNDKQNAVLLGRKVSIEATDSIVYDHSTYEDGELDSLTFRWNDTWLHILRLEYDLAFTRSSFDLTADKGWPSPKGEPELLLE